MKDILNFTFKPTSKNAEKILNKTNEEKKKLNKIFLFSVLWITVLLFLYFFILNLEQLNKVYLNFLILSWITIIISILSFLSLWLASYVSLNLFSVNKNFSESIFIAFSPIIILYFFQTIITILSSFRIINLTDNKVLLIITIWLMIWWIIISFIFYNNIFKNFLRTIWFLIITWIIYKIFEKIIEKITNFI